jgi:hypothetical protein
VELENVTAEIRPRSQWEAIDLGVSLVRAHAIGLLKGWMASVYPACLLILAVCWNSIGWGLFLIWWLKPIWERVALHPLSRSLFGEHPTWRETMKVLPTELLKNKGLALMGVTLTWVGWLIHSVEETSAAAGFGVLFWLTVIGLVFYRSGLSRSLVLPIRYLEGLGGPRYKTRTQVLSYRSSGSAVGLTFICLLMELLLLASQVWFVLMMSPVGTVVNDYIFHGAEYGNFTDMLPTWVWVMFAIFYLNSMSVVAWFYTGAGFGLYVNTRTWTEGWDIELKFKRLGQRLGIIFVGLALLGGTPVAEANQEARRILESEEFDVRTREVFAPKEKKEEKTENEGAGIFAGIGHVLFWIIMGVAVAGLVWVIIANVHLFRKGGPSESAEDRKKVTTVAGMNVEPKNLPPNLVESARMLWDEGRNQESLGLLYRGAISSLVTGQLVEIEESDTEMDCLRRVTLKGDAANASYFKILTGAWMSQAYARCRPNDATVSQLWRNWPYHERREG